MNKYKIIGTVLQAVASLFVFMVGLYYTLEGDHSFTIFFLFVAGILMLCHTMKLIRSKPMNEVKKYKKGQLVYAIYHHTMFFHPPSPGRISSNKTRWMKHRFSRLYGLSDYCHWYKVKFPHLFWSQWIPETCLEDLAEDIRRTTHFLELKKDSSEQPGFEGMEYFKLIKNNEKAIRYLKENLGKQT